MFIDYLSSNVKRYFTSDNFLLSSGNLKTPNWPYFGNYARFDKFIHSAGSVYANYLCVANHPAQQKSS